MESSQAQVWARTRERLREELLHYCSAGHAGAQCASIIECISGIIYSDAGRGSACIGTGGSAAAAGACIGTSACTFAGTSVGAGSGNRTGHSAVVFALAAFRV